jgi:hypothetical protein
MPREGRAGLAGLERRIINPRRWFVRWEPAPFRQRDGCLPLGTNPRLIRRPSHRRTVQSSLLSPHDGPEDNEDGASQ